MLNPKIEQLLEFLKEDPDDTFTLYALALEYDKNDPSTAGHFYEKLLTDHPTYTATYYHAGKFYEKTGQKTKAEIVYRKGMVLTYKEGKQKAYSELQKALNNLLFEESD
jgi:tetratricopeptide (TPR) repeat protein